MNEATGVFNWRGDGLEACWRSGGSSTSAMMSSSAIGGGVLVVMLCCGPAVKTPSSLMWSCSLAMEGVELVVMMLLAVGMGERIIQNV